MYQLKDNQIIRLSDNAFIPHDEGNRDYAAYKAWVAEGGTPEVYVAPPPTLKEEHDERVTKRNTLLDQNDWVVMRHRDQIELGIPTTLTEQAYRETLVRRQQLRDMSDTSLIK